MRVAARARSRARTRGDSGERGRETCAPPLSLSSARARLPVGPMGVTWASSPPAQPLARPVLTPGPAGRGRRGVGQQGRGNGRRARGKGGPSIGQAQAAFFLLLRPPDRRARASAPAHRRALFSPGARGHTRCAALPRASAADSPRLLSTGPPKHTNAPGPFAAAQKKRHARVRLRTQASERPRHARSGTGGRGGGGITCPGGGRQA